MASQPFQFKQFTVAQDRCAMKIGTDGVLLGAWTAVDQFPNSILDIGTGTGVIALMLAQRSDAPTIDALELDENAYEQAVENFENSPWGDRLFCYHAHLYEFALEIDDTYDVIVVNPPFFEEDYKTPEASRNQARFEDAMPFDLLVGAVAKLLAPEGRFNIIIPYKREDDFISLSAKANLYPTHITRVRGNAKANLKRSMLRFAFNPPSEAPVIDELIIEHSRHQYTDTYISLVQDFYLKM